MADLMVEPQPAHEGAHGRTRAGVGYSENANSRLAGAEAASTALAQVGANQCQLALVFGTSKHDPAALRDGVRSVLGPDTRLIGGAAVGVMTNDRLGYEGHQVGVAVIHSPSLEVDMFIERDLPGRERAVGHALGRQIAAGEYDGDPNLLLLYDIVKSRTTTGLDLNMATPLIAGLGESIGNWPRMAGGGLVGDLQFNPGYQIFDDRVEEQSAMALMLHGGVRMDTIIMHGCKPASDYHTITKSDGTTVLEMSGRPALELVTELMGADYDASNWQDYPLFINIGINQGDKFGEYREDDYAVRLCMDVDKERGGMVFFGDDMVPGVEVQLMRRSISFDYMTERTQRLLEQVRPRRPFLALYIDCAGRAAALSATEHEDAEEVQKVIGDEVPLLGWYVGCELAKAGGNMQSHNFTGVLCVLSEEV